MIPNSFGKRVVVTIKSDGSHRVETFNFHGQGCKDVTDSFARGDTLIEETAKPEFYEPDETVSERERETL
jgi:hypothetical protein